MNLHLGPHEIWHWLYQSQGQQFSSIESEEYNYFHQIQNHFHVWMLKSPGGNNSIVQAMAV